MPTAALTNADPTLAAPVAAQRAPQPLDAEGALTAVADARALLLNAFAVLPRADSVGNVADDPTVTKIDAVCDRLTGQLLLAFPGLRRAVTKFGVRS